MLDYIKILVFSQAPVDVCMYVCVYVFVCISYVCLFVCLCMYFICLFVCLCVCLCMAHMVRSSDRALQLPLLRRLRLLVSSARSEFSSSS